MTDNPTPPERSISDQPASKPARAEHVPRPAGAETSSHWERNALERVALAAINEQRASRRWKIFFRFAFLAVFVAIASGIFGIPGERAVSKGRHTALVELSGEIASRSDASAENIGTALENAFNDANAVGVILRINSPGGSPVQAGMINAEIRRLRQQYPAKPLYVVVEDMCASGGYYVAAAADKIYVDKASIVGSIGVLMDGFGFSGLMKTLGIERRMHTSGENKGFYDPFSPETDKMKQHAQQMLNDIHAQFIAAVRQGRGKRLKETPELFSGLFWTGDKSVEMGLADGFGDADHVAREVIKAPDIVDYTVKESITNRVARKFGAAAGYAAFHALVAGAKWQVR